MPRTRRDAAPPQLDRDAVDARLRALEDEVPALRGDVGAFFWEFEARVLRLSVEASDPAYVLDQARAIVERARLDG